MNSLVFSSILQDKSVPPLSLSVPSQLLNLSVSYDRPILNLPHCPNVLLHADFL